MDIQLLVDNFKAYKKVARWYFDEWASSVDGVTLEKIEERISKSINRNLAPLMVLANMEDEVVGAAELKIREMDIFPEYKFWIGGVYVDARYRSRGIGKQLVQDIIHRAKNAGISKLYLQTEYLTGGIYVEFGFKPLQEVCYKNRQVLIMVAEVNA